jgi:hypothetical protein
MLPMEYLRIAGRRALAFIWVDCSITGWPQSMSPIRQQFGDLCGLPEFRMRRWGLPVQLPYLARQWRLRSGRIISRQAQNRSIRIRCG